MFAALLVLPSMVGAQAPTAAEEAYFRAVASYFRVPVGEVSILRDWRLPADEIPVVLFVAAQAGVSPEAIVALRRADGGWSSLMVRYGLESGALYVPVPDEAPVSGLSRVYDSFRTLPARRWGEIRLEDREIVALVNVRLIAESLRIRPADVLRSADLTRSFVEIYGELARR